MNWIRRWKQRRAEKKRLKELSAFAGGFKSLDKMEETGLLAWNTKTRQLFIDHSLAYVMLKDVESWQNFLNNVFLWQYSRLCQQAWNDYFLKEELKAVKDYKQAHKEKPLNRKDVERIREARRQEILLSEMDSPKVEGFEFFIVSPPDLKDTTPQDPSSPVGRLTAVGYYDPEKDKLEMALWKDVERLLKEN